MDIIFYINTSDNNVLNKTLSVQKTLTGSLKNECTIINPTIIIEDSGDVINYNYLFIPEFGRYYFIDDVRIIKRNVFEISASVDVLQSFRPYILNLPVILEDSETTGADKYLQSDVWVSKVKTKTDIINFPNGLNETGEFILITAGG